MVKSIHRRRSWALAALASLFVGACSGPSTRDVRVTIVDEYGEALPGAVFYAEVTTEGGPLAFDSGLAGDAGEVPRSAREPWKLPWQSGASLTLAAFAPGKAPTIWREVDRPIDSDGARIRLVPWEDAPPELAERLASIGFPFQGVVSLADLARGPGHRPLASALLRSWRESAERRPSEAPPEATLTLLREIVSSEVPPP